MPGGLSVDSTIKLAVQSAQGTPATTGFLCAIAEESGLATQFEYNTTKNEHGCAPVAHMFTQRSRKVRTGVMSEGAANGNLYPIFPMALMRGLGFAKATTGTTVKTNVFTPAPAGSDVYLTGLSKVGSDAERRFVDLRVASATFNFSPTDGVTYQSTLQALTEDDPTGSETVTNEKGYAMSTVHAAGIVEWYFDPEGANTLIEADGLECALTIETTLDGGTGGTLRSITKPGLYRKGIKVTGNLKSTRMLAADYNRIIRGAAAGTSSSTSTAVFKLVLKAVTTAVIPTTATPYSWQFDLPLLNVDLEAASRRASGDNTVYFNFPFELEASGATPMTVTAINDVAAI